MSEYDERRAAMAAATRRRILDACITVLARGADEFSIPNVAKKAKVSVPTVYRNFPDKKELLAATVAHMRGTHGARPLTSYEELPGLLRHNYTAGVATEERYRAAMASAPLVAAKHTQQFQEARMKLIADALAPQLAKLPEEDRARAHAMLTVICSSDLRNALARLCGQSPAEAAETAIWAAERLLAPRTRR